MPCDTRLKQGQTISQRVDEVKRVVARLDSMLASGRARAIVGPQGAVAFEGLSTEERDGVTDACAYRRLMSSGSSLAKAALARAEAMSGRTIDRQMVAQGAHSHDGGRTWHSHKG